MAKSQSNKMQRLRAWRKWRDEQTEKRPEQLNPKVAFMTGWNMRHAVEQKKRTEKSA